MVEIISILNVDFRLYRWDGLPREEVSPDDRVAAAGDYVILRPGKFLIYAARITKLIP